MALWSQAWLLTKSFRDTFKCGIGCAYALDTRLDNYQLYVKTKGKNG